MHVQSNVQNLNQSEIARLMAIDASMLSKVLNGTRRVSFQFIENFCAVLAIHNEEQDELWVLAGFGRPLARQRSHSPLFSNQPLHDGKSLEEIANNLDSWKQIHTTVQALFLSLGLFIESVEVLAKNLNDQNADDVEHRWSSLCEPKAHKIRKVLANTRLNHVEDLVELENMLQGEDSIVELIQVVDVSNTLTVQHLRSSTFRLRELLIELLDLADLNIIHIAQDIKTLSASAS